MFLSTPESHVKLPPIVLLVEDDDSTREMYEAAFSRDGLWVAETSSPAEALQYASELRPDVVVTDIAFGGRLDGLVLAQELRRQPKLADVPLLAVTGLAPDGLDDRQALFASVLQKPVKPEQLIRDVRAALTRAADVRARAEHVRGWIPPLLQESRALAQQSGRIKAMAGRWTQEPRTCPRCGEPLRWVERRPLDGLLFDYYQPCGGGCGLFCYDHSLQRLVTLLD